MKKKNILIIVAALILFAGTTVTAWNLGGILTPEEFAEQDFDKHDFNPVPAGTEIFEEGTRDARLIATITIDSFKKISETEYEEAEKMLAASVKIKRYVDCRTENKTIQECYTVMQAGLVSEAAKQVLSEKDFLELEQIEAVKFALYAEELQAGNITITQAEINAEIERLKTAVLEEP